MAELSLEEKVGQLGSYWPVPAARRSAMHRRCRPDGDGVLPGQLLGGRHRARPGPHHPQLRCRSDQRPGRASPQLRRLQADVVAASPHGIPAIVHEECLTGFTALGATVYPAAIAWGATFDPGLVRRMAAAIGEDMRAVGVHQGLSPLLDVVRDYRWGRVEETCGRGPLSGRHPRIGLRRGPAGLRG